VNPIPTVNEAAQVVGDDGIRAFFWENEAVTEFSAPDINENGVVVGTAAFRSVPGFTKPLHNAMGWIWTKDGRLVWLDDLIDPALGIEITGAKNLTDDGLPLGFS
jgi:hypothetical protein